MSKAAPAAPRLEAEHGPLEDLEFRGSPETSVGVELELQILDREGGDLTAGAVRLLAACKEEGLAGVTAEFLQSQLEVKTGVCRDVAAVRAELFPLLRRVRNIAHSLGCELALGGTHPFAKCATAAVFPDARYQRIEQQMAWLAYRGQVFGLHVHVGVPDGDLAMGVINALVQYLPHLLALSASSPFWEGVDTGLASARSALFRLSPHSGLPHYFPRWKDFCAYCRVMHACRAIRATKDLYWDIRPRPQTGTVEFRVCDMPLTLGRVFGLAALVRTLTAAARRALEERPRARRGDLRRNWIAAENKWLATRYGLDAKCIRTPGGRRRGLAEDVAGLLDLLLPTARETGDAEFLEALRAGGRPEVGADRLRRLYREAGDWPALIDEMTRPWAQELAEAETAAV
jgi:glutamate---cysteine ligase / carboxylate-amine ligase